MPEQETQHPEWAMKAAIHIACDPLFNSFTGPAFAKLVDRIAALLAEARGEDNPLPMRPGGNPRIKQV